MQAVMHAMGFAFKPRVRPMSININTAIALLCKVIVSAIHFCMAMKRGSTFQEEQAQELQNGMAF